MKIGGWYKIIGALVLGIILLPGSAEALTFSPERIFLEGKRGETLERSIEIVNEEKFAVVVQARVADFEAGAKMGVPEFVAKNQSNGLSLIAKLPVTDFELPPSGRKKFTYIVKIPEAPQGSYFGAIHFAISSKSGATNQVAVTGPLVFVTVTGATDGLLTYKNQSDSSIYFNQPREFKVMIENHGSTFESPEGKVTIKNFFGQTLAVYALRDPGRVILPGESREIFFAAPEMVDNFIQNAVWTWGFGPYTASAEINYGQGQKLRFQAGNYWVFSWPLFAITFLICGLVVWLLGWHKEKK
jgi:hypothetical protein